MSLDYCTEQQTNKSACEAIPKCAWCGPNPSYIEKDSFCYTNTSEISCCPATYNDGRSHLCNLTSQETCQYYRTNDPVSHALCCHEKSYACGTREGTGVCCEGNCCYDQTESYSTCCSSSESCCATNGATPVCCKNGTDCCPANIITACCLPGYICCNNIQESWCCPPSGRCSTEYGKCLDF